MPADQLPLPHVDQEDTLSMMRRLASKLVELEGKIDEKEKELNLLKEEHQKISCGVLADVMTQTGLTELVLTEGRKILLKPQVFASISKARMPHVVEWLKERNMDGIVKRHAVVSEVQLGALDMYQIPYQREESIHSSTLKAFVRERLDADPDFPRELFGVSVVPTVTVQQ